MKATPMEEVIINYIVAEIHGGDPDLDISAEDDLLGSGLLGSMEMMRVVEHIERSFDFRVAPQDMAIENFMTVAAMVKYIESVKAR
jgi:acyl carrier protein